jgi:hypothetical protein
MRAGPSRAAPVIIAVRTHLRGYKGLTDIEKQEVEKMIEGRL